MKTYEKRVQRKWILWLVSTILVLVILLALAYAFLSLLDSVGNQHGYLILVGGMFIVVSFVLGQSLNNILVRSWDTWMGDLGPAQIEILREELALEAIRLKKENGK